MKIGGANPVIINVSYKSNKRSRYAYSQNSDTLWCTRNSVCSYPNGPLDTVGIMSDVSNDHILLVLNQ